jgi:hypothetical protein
MTTTLKPSPEDPKVTNFEITLEIETGNLIYKRFETLEELRDFINDTAQNPAKIKEIISPKKREGKIGEQIGFYNVDTNDDDDW